jgi:molecular chaperone GrpE (heat shock protein)
MLREVVEDALEAVGVRALTADGEKFDPALHEAAAPIPAPRPEDHGHVAATERRGYADGDEVIRKPTVSVYRQDA